MIVYATKFYVKKELSTKLFIGKALQWINESPHYAFDGVQWDGKDIFVVNTKNEKFSIYILEKEEIVAVQLQALDDQGEHWKSEFILSQNDEYNVLSVRLSKNSDDGNTVKSGMYFHRPRLMRQILSEHYGEMDNVLQISDAPTIVSTENIQILHNLISGKFDYLMPVVYVTKTFENNEACLDVKELAKDLAGTAHVLVEEDTNVTSKLRSMVEDKNPFNGAVHIYYSSHMGTRFVPDESMDENKFRYTITSSVFRRLTILRADEISWNAIRYKKLREEYKKRQAEHLEDQKVYEELLEAQEEEIKDCKLNLQSAVDNIQTLENENIAQQGQLQLLETKMRQKFNCKNGEKISIDCNENELYEGEIKDLILELIENHIKTMEHDSNRNICRTFHILDSIANSNTKIGKRSDLENRIKQAFSKLGKLDAKSQRELKEIGFTIQDSENHIKLYFHNDSRYCVLLSKSPSDYRGGKNVASDAIKLLIGK